MLSGILNGIDANVWNPARRSPLGLALHAPNGVAGQGGVQGGLQRELGLARRPDAPLIGMIGRLDKQKGLDLVAEVIPEWVAQADLPMGDPRQGRAEVPRGVRRPGRRFPEKVAVRMEFSEPLAHRIEAGADIFLMPSRFEPCGLNQMYSLRYGTVPVVRETGGLADTIVDANDQTLAAGTANGLSFRENNAQALSETLRRACAAYRRPEVWSRLVATGMGQDWSWSRSAKEYVKLYEQTIARAKKGRRSRRGRRGREAVGKMMNDE